MEYSDSYSKTPKSLYQFCRDKPKNPITDSESSKFKWRSLDNTKNDDIINVEIAAVLKSFSDSSSNTLN